MYSMVDMAVPPSDEELSDWQGSIYAVAGYIGGVNNGGRSWTPADVSRVIDAGYRFLPIYVGQNICATCDGSKLTLAQGQADAVDTLNCLRDFGLSSGPVCLDIEYQTYASKPNETDSYVLGWNSGIKGTSYRGVIYQPLAMAVTRTYLAGSWVAYWVKSTPDAPMPATVPVNSYGNGWQYKNYGDYDESLVDGKWWDNVKIASNSRTFSTGFRVSLGMLAYYDQNGGTMAFGLPLSQEVPITPTRTRQWFERAVLEWNKGSDPLHFDIIGRRVCADLLLDMTADYMADKETYPDKFVTPK